MSIEVILQEDQLTPHNPPIESLQLWVDTALQQINNAPKDGEIIVKIIDKEESAVLNQTFRDKAGPTNVLSFSYDNPTDYFTGDLAICADLVKNEAHDQDKLIIAHWAHLVVHGTLHLMGYDHVEDSDADIMEALETKIMLQLGFEDPY